MMTKGPAEVPYTILIDQREKAPYRFGQLGDPDQASALQVRTQVTTLSTGDYTLAGLESQVAIERKSLADLFATLGRRREQFEAEHKRMAEMDFAAVIIEASWEQILFSPPPESQLRPETVLSTAIAWSQRYGVHWWCVPSRRAGEVTTFRMLDRFWRERE